MTRSSLALALALTSALARLGGAHRVVAKAKAQCDGPESAEETAPDFLPANATNESNPMPLMDVTTTEHDGTAPGLVELEGEVCYSANEYDCVHIEQLSHSLVQDRRLPDDICGTKSGIKVKFNKITEDAFQPYLDGGVYAYTSLFDANGNGYTFKKDDYVTVMGCCKDKKPILNERASMLSFVSNSMGAKAITLVRCDPTKTGEASIFGWPPAILQPRGAVEEAAREGAEAERKRGTQCWTKNEYQCVQISQLKKWHGFSDRGLPDPACGKDSKVKVYFQKLPEFGGGDVYLPYLHGEQFAYSRLYDVKGNGYSFHKDDFVRVVGCCEENTPILNKVATDFGVFSSLANYGNNAILTEALTVVKCDPKDTSEASNVGWPPAIFNPRGEIHD